MQTNLERHTREALFNALCDLDIIRNPNLDDWAAVSCQAVIRLQKVIQFLEEAREIPGRRSCVANGLTDAMQEFTGNT